MSFQIHGLQLFFPILCIAFSLCFLCCAEVFKFSAVPSIFAFFAYAFKCHIQEIIAKFNAMKLLHVVC